MKRNHKIYKTLCIDITTYKTVCKTKKPKMNAETSEKHIKSQNKFICSICLNQKSVNDVKDSELRERKSRSCPVCQCSCSYSTDDDSTLTKRSRQSRNNLINDKDRKVTRNVQTSHADVTQGLTLLNEVLNVFQSKKQLNNPKETRSKTLIFKDVGVSTEDINYSKAKPKLSMSKVFQFSIEDNCNAENKFTIISSTQPDIFYVSHKSLDLINHKSSSIPQMKLEELKQSLKIKTKSKDVIEEANRMFATVKRVEETDSNENRPMVRSGPRVLPVVKTGNFEAANDETHKPKPKINEIHKPCLENDYHMSSGDSSAKNKCCRNCSKGKGLEDCTYTMCCHYQKYRQPAKELICKQCRMAQ